MKKEDRKRRIRTRLKARGDRPRLSVFVSNRHIYAQIIDDKTGRTLASATDKEVEQKGGKTVDVAKRIGKLIAEKARDKKIDKVVLDRGRARYHGRLRSFADGAREGGLNF